MNFFVRTVTDESDMLADSWGRPEGRPLPEQEARRRHDVWGPCRSLRSLVFTPNLCHDGAPFAS